MSWSKQDKTKRTAKAGNELSLCVRELNSLILDFPRYYYIILIINYYSIMVKNMYVHKKS